jgi:hypothetical protein
MFVTRSLRLVAAAAVVLGFVAALGTSPASADAGGTMQFTQLSDAVVGLIGGPSPLPFTCAGPQTGTTSFTGTGNGVVHENGSKTGFWATTTQEGQVTLTMSPGDTYTGKLAFWFALEGNNQNMVVHATLDLHGVDTTTGDPATIHVDFQKASNAAGDVTAQHFDAICT